MELRKKKVLVTGATGFIGGHLALKLKALGAEVRALVRNPNRAKDLQAAEIEIVPGDLQDPDSLRAAVRGCQLVFHFAAALGHESSSWAFFQKLNVAGTRYLAEAALVEGVERFVHASSIWAYGLTAGKNTNEKTPRHRCGSPYADTKLAGEMLILDMVRTAKLPAVIVQPAIVYGPRDEAFTLAPLKLMLAGRMILPGFGKGLANPIYIDDLVEGILIVTKRGVIGESYILNSGEVVTFREFFGYLGQMIGRSHFPSIPRWMALLLASTAELAAKLTRTRPVLTVESVRGTTMQVTYLGQKAYDLGFKPTVNLAEGMRRVGVWLKQEGRSYLQP